MTTLDRIDKVRATFEEHELDSIFISSSENRRYLSGFTGSAGYLLITPTDAVLNTDFRYVEQAETQAPDFRIERIKGKLDWFPKLAASMGAERIGFEAQDVTVDFRSAIQKAIDEDEESPKPELVQTSDLVDKIRATKDAAEISILERAIEITDEAIEEVSARIQPGVTENEVAWELEKAMRERGAEAVAFDTIVGAGPNGALPHHGADDTVIAEGQPIVIDMGAKYEGYCADLTRTIVIGEPDETFRKVYNIVLKAQLEAEEQVAVGMTGSDVDKIARDVIEEAGYGETFGHSLGHGVGLAVHEYPRVGPGADDVLADDMAFTIEPGIYISGWGGVRIEDVVVLENGRARILSKAKKLEYSE